MCVRGLLRPSPRPPGSDRRCPTESSIFIAKFQDEFTAWNPASTVVPNRAAEATVITIAARMASVRMNSGRPSPPAAAMPDRRGRSAAPSAFAHSTAGTVRNSPMNHCAIIVAAPDPAMPQPNPNTNSTSSMVLSTAPHTAATNVMRTFCKPRKMPFAAYTSSMPGRRVPPSAYTPPPGRASRPCP